MLVTARTPRKRRPRARYLQQSPVRALRVQKLALAVQSACVAAQRSVGAYHAVTWDNDRDRVRPIGGADRTYRVGLAYGARNIGVAPGLAERNAAEFPPHGFLEGGTPNIDRQLRRGLRVLDGLQRAFDP